jgi:stringent starvation protein B
MTEMTPSRPYLIRAIYDWIVDNGCTPHVLVNTQLEGVEVPVQYVKDDKIILNVGPNATQALVIDNQDIRFSARFGGVSTQVKVPTRAVMTIYARETGQGMVFAEDDDDPKPPQPTPPRPNLRVVK